MCPFCLESRISLPRPSATIRKRREAKGNRCLMPLPGLKKYVAYPFMRIVKDTKTVRYIKPHMRMHNLNIHTTKSIVCLRKNKF